MAGDAKEHILDRDKKRSQHYNNYTGQVWGMAENYDICLSSFYGAEGCVRQHMFLCDTISKSDK